MILQTDAAACGGISEWRRIAQMAVGYGVAKCPHWFHDLHTHLVASAPNAHYVEYFPDDKVLNFRKVLNRQLRPVDGDLLLSRTPGLGFEFTEDVAAKYGSENEKVWSTVK
jgi:L-alanine-DL-glutamate epimerase-like enolase superfamily enzyme